MGVGALQSAFIECGAVQCGFCTPGMLMAAKGLLDRTPDPTDEQIHEMAQGAVDARGGDHAGAFMELHVEDIENILKNAR